MITGLYDAKLDHVPVLAIVGQVEVTVRGASYQQEINLDRVFADVATYVQEAETPAQLRHIVDRGIRAAVSGNGVAIVILPKDVQDEPWEGPQAVEAAQALGAGVAKALLGTKPSYDLMTGCGRSASWARLPIGGKRSSSAPWRRLTRSIRSVWCGKCMKI
jgi:pyruvate dehydrogenase (quinone)